MAKPAMLPEAGRTEAGPTETGPSITRIREVGQPDSVIGRVNAEHWAGRLYMRRFSPYATRLLLRTSISANGVTWLMIVSGVLAAAGGGGPGPDRTLLDRGGTGGRAGHPCRRRVGLDRRLDHAGALGRRARVAGQERDRPGGRGPCPGRGSGPGGHRLPTGRGRDAPAPPDHRLPAVLSHVHRRGVLFPCARRGTRRRHGRQPGRDPHTAAGVPAGRRDHGRRAPGQRARLESVAMTAMTASPTLAVELPSYGAVLLTQGTRPQELATAIASLRAQRGVRLDLVVVGNGVQPAPLPTTTR